MHSKAFRADLLENGLALAQRVDGSQLDWWGLNQAFSLGQAAGSSELGVIPA